MNSLESMTIYLCLLSLGLLLVLLTIRSLSEQQSRLLFTLQVVLTILFAACVKHPLACLAAYECRVGKHNRISLFLPSLLYGGIQYFTKQHTFPHFIAIIK